jgi:hypothetical protein
MLFSFSTLSSTLLLKSWYASSSS